MFSKNTAVFGIDPTPDRADAADAALSAKGSRSTTRPAALSAPDPATAPLADFVPDSWPNSGFRNSTRRGTKGR